MGWCGATEIFDTIVDAVIEYVPEDQRWAVMEKIAEPLWKEDWDCETDSKYWDDYLVHIMYNRDMIDDEDYEYYTSFRMNK